MSLWTDATLVVDADLTAVESRHPEAAKKVKGDSNQSAYDGKRAAAKRKIGKALERRGIDPDGLKDPAQLKDAAVYLELALIFRDLAQRNDTVASEKAAHYQQEYEEEISSIKLEWSDPGETPKELAQPFAMLMRA